jgi:hypothetical protein
MALEMNTAKTDALTELRERLAHLERAERLAKSVLAKSRNHPLCRTAGPTLIRRT